MDNITTSHQNGSCSIYPKKLNHMPYKASITSIKQLQAWI